MGRSGMRGWLLVALGVLASACGGEEAPATGASESAAGSSIPDALPGTPPEVEAALLTHPLVQECGVVGVPDDERGMVVKAFVVLADGAFGDAALVRALQDHVKAEIAPYKYPRRVEFVARLPRTETGKLQRFALRQGVVA